MLFFLQGRVEEHKVSPDEMHLLVQEEIEAIHAAKAAGKIVAAYHVYEQPQVMGIVDVESRNELDQLLADLPMAHILEWQEILPVYEL